MNSRTFSQTPYTQGKSHRTLFMQLVQEEGEEWPAMNKHHHHELPRKMIAKEEDEAGP